MKSSNTILLLLNLNNLFAFVGQSCTNCGPAVVRHHCSQQGQSPQTSLFLSWTTHWRLQPESPTSSLAALLLGTNSASTHGCQEKKDNCQYFPFTALLANMTTFTLRYKARPMEGISDPGLSRSHPLDIAPWQQPVW